MPKKMSAETLALRRAWRERYSKLLPAPPPLMRMFGAVVVRGAATKDCQCNSMKRFRNIRFVRQLT